MSWTTIDARPRLGLQPAECGISVQAGPRLNVWIGDAVLDSLNWRAGTRVGLLVGAGDHVGFLRVMAADSGLRLNRKARVLGGAVGTTKFPGTLDPAPHRLTVTPHTLVDHLGVCPGLEIALPGWLLGARHQDVRPRRHATHPSGVYLT